jgi:Domain of unknown function (DUF4349)
MKELMRSLTMRFPTLSPASRGLLWTAALLVALGWLVLLALHKGSVPPSHSPAGTAGIPHRQPLAREEMPAMVPQASDSAGYRLGTSELGPAAAEPRMAYSAEVAILTKEFARSRSSLEEILDRHRGYVAKLRMVGQPASVLSATLRIPSSEYSSALADLKSLGRVEREEESADEITQQQADWEARLINAQNTEQRLQRWLENPPAKGRNTEIFERQLAAVRTEIARIEAGRQAFLNRTVFASVLFSLREEVASPVVTFGAHLRRAASNGLAEAATSISTILIFVVNYGPSLLLWVVILILPARFVWRRSRLLFARTTS